MPTRLKRHFIKIISIIVILLVGIGFTWWHHHKKNQAPSAMPPTLVKIAPVTERNVANTFSTIGTIKALQGTDISASVTGKIASIQFTSGQIVKQGQVLFTLENGDLAATVQQDQAKYTYDSAQYQRYSKLSSIGVVSKANFDQQKSAMQQSAAQLAHDKALLDKTIITAPFSGTLGVVQVSVGQYVNEGEAVVTLQDNSTLFVDFNIPEHIRDLIAVGQSIHATSSQTKNYHWQGLVQAVNPTMDNDSRTVLVRAKVTPPYTNLVPGMYVTVATPLSAEKLTVVIPQKAVIYNPYGNMVFVYDKGIVTQRPVTLGERVDADIIVLNGLKPNEQIVVSGQQKLFNGMPVQLAKDNA